MVRQKWPRLVLFLLACVLILAWAFPRLVAALPGRYKVYLPDPVLELVTTPLPTALPTAAVAAAPLQITIPPLPTPTLVSLPPTYTPVYTSIVAETAVASPSPLADTTTATPLPTATATVTPIPLPVSAHIDGLKVIPQKFNNCGPTNLTMTLNFYGHAVDQLEVAAVIKPNYDDRNVSPWELRDYVNDYTTLRADYYSGGNLTQLKRLIAAGYPVIVEKGYLPAEHGWMGHYLTLFAYDDTVREFYGMDSFLGPWDSSGLSESYENLNQFWQHFNYTFLVVYPAKEAKVVQQLIDPALQDPTTMWQTAAQQAQADIDETPNNAYAWFNLGTNLTELGHLTDDPRFYQNAVAAFDQARQIGLPPRMLWYQFQPYAAYLENGRIDDVLTLTDVTAIGQGSRDIEETYLYRGHALLARNDVNGARAAYRQALALHADFPPALEALQRLEDGG